MFSSLLNSFGLDISDLSAKLIFVKTNYKNERVVRAWARGSFPEGVIVNGEIRQPEKAAEALSTMLNDVRAALGTPYVIASLPESKTFIKVIEVSAEGDLARAVMDELPNHIPIALDELIVDWNVVRTFENRIMVTIGAVPKIVAESYTELFTTCGLKPTAFEIEAQAIARAVTPIPHRTGHTHLPVQQSIDKVRRLLSHSPTSGAPLPQETSNGARLVVDLGATRSSLIMVDWSTIQFTSSVELSGIDTTKQISERLKLTFDEAERAKQICGLDPKKCKGVVSTVLEGMLNHLAMEIERAVEFYRTHFKRGHAVEEVLLTGGGANLANVETLLARQLSVPVHIGNPLMNIATLPLDNDSFPLKETLTFTTALGLAIRDESNTL